MHGICVLYSRLGKIAVNRERNAAATRSWVGHSPGYRKQRVKLLHGFGMSVEYNRILRAEAQIEKHDL